MSSEPCLAAKALVSVNMEPRPCRLCVLSVYWQERASVLRGTLEPRGDARMSDDEFRAGVRRFFDGVWNKGNVGEAEAFLAPEFVSHNTLDMRIVGPREYGGAVTDYRAA